MSRIIVMQGGDVALYNDGTSWYIFILEDMRLFNGKMFLGNFLNMQWGSHLHWDVPHDGEFQSRLFRFKRIPECYNESQAIRTYFKYRELICGSSHS